MVHFFPGSSYIRNMIKKRPGGGYGVAHCHGSRRGKFITKRRMTKAKAVKVHRAIQTNKKRKRR